MRFLSFLKKILVPEEPIAGLEISDSRLRLVLLGLNKQDGSIVTREQAEHALPSGVIVNGELKKSDKLFLALTELKKKFKTPIDYIVASIPADKIYTKILSFPKNVEGAKLDEAIKLAFDFQLPLKSDKAYFSWEVFSGESAQEVFVSEAEKKTIDPYLECLHKIFNLVALEFPAESFARVSSGEKDEPILLKITNQTSQNFFIIKNGVVRFSRSIGQNSPDKKSKKEAEKIIAFYEASSEEKVSHILNLGQDPVGIKKEINFSGPSDSGWLIALGAARRGLIPRYQDNFISLSPISAQKAYKYHKAVSFVSIITKLIVGLSIFFIAAFMGTWVLIITLQQQAAQKTDDLSNLPAMPDLNAVEQKIQKADSLILTTAGILKSSPRWSGFIDEFQKLITDGITVNSLSLPSPEETITLTGLAKNRSILNKFRDSLKSSDLLKEVRLPLTNLEQREDIPFTISFQLKDPKSIYIK
jgi:Tfp pilus assembly protein PilN